MRPLRYPLIFAGISVCFLCACGTIRVGQDFDLSGFEGKVKRGVTSKADVRAWLGEPAGIGVAVETSGDPFEEWMYYQGEGQLPNVANAHLKLLQIKFDPQGVVRAYNWSGESK